MCTNYYGVQLFQEAVDATVEVSKTFDGKIKKYCVVTLMSLAYAGTGNVDKVTCLRKPQKMHKLQRGCTISKIY